MNRSASGIIPSQNQSASLTHVSDKRASNITSCNPLLRLPTIEASHTTQTGCAVYAIVNTLNWKSYIGSSNNFKRRMKEHREVLNRGQHSNKYLQKAWIKHGITAFEVWILEAVNTETDLLKVEQKYLDTIGSLYNISDLAGRGPSVRSAEWRANISAARKGKASAGGPEITGRHLSEAHRRNLSIALTGKKKTAEHIANAAAALKGRPKRPHTLERRRRQSERMMGRTMRPEVVKKSADSRRGIKRTVEQRARMADAQRGRKRRTSQLMLPFK